MVTSRGCPYQCRFCTSEPGRRFAGLPLEQVRADLALLADHGVQQIWLLDAIANAAADLDEAIAGAYDAVRSIRFENAHYRTDIAAKAARHAFETGDWPELAVPVSVVPEAVRDDPGIPLSLPWTRTPMARSQPKRLRRELMRY